MSELPDKNYAYQLHRKQAIQLPQITAKIGLSFAKIAR